MAIVLYRKNKTDKLRKNGVQAMATVREVLGFSIRMINNVLIEYTVKETGATISKNIRVGGVPYKEGDQLPIYYDPHKPRRIQLDYKKGFLPMLIFTILIGIFSIFAAIKIYEAVSTGQM